MWIESVERRESCGIETTIFLEEEDEKNEKEEEDEMRC